MTLFLEVFVFSIILSLDSFTAALALACRPFSSRNGLRFAIVSGLSEGLIAAAGFWAGKHILAYISSYDHWVAFILLFAVGLRMLWDALKRKTSDENAEIEIDGHSPLKLLIVSLATSIDALGIGLSLGVADKPIIFYVPSIAISAFIATMLGLRFGATLRRRVGGSLEAVGGLILMAFSFSLLQI